MNDRKSGGIKPLAILGLALIALWTQCDGDAATPPLPTIRLTPQPAVRTRLLLPPGGAGLPGWEHRVGGVGIGGTDRPEDFYFIDRRGTSY